MNEIQVFQNQDFGQVRTIQIDGQPWFVGRDVADALGYANPQKAVRDHVDEDDKRVNESFIVNGTYGILINESGLYSLIMSSKLPSAKKFKRWVTSEVLPAIRKSGSYQVSGYQTKATSVGEVVNLIKMTRQSMKDQRCDPREIAIAVKEICDQFNIQLPDCFIKPKETNLQDAIDMIDFIYSQPNGNKSPTYEDFIVAQISVKRLKGR